MWFSEKALVFVDTRSAAVAVYQRGWGGPRLLRFACERFTPPANQEAPFRNVLAVSADSVSRLARDLRAPQADATLLLPLGAAYPSMVDLTGLHKAGSVEVDETDAVRFRLAPLLPFPVSQAEVRTESSPSIGSGVILAQAILKNVIEENERGMSALGFRSLRVCSALSAAFRGLTPEPRVVDLVFGDSACAIAVRNARGAAEAIHLRLLSESDDRGRRALDEAIRATPDPREIRVIGEDVAALRRRDDDPVIRPAFDPPAAPESPDLQQFPFLAAFQGRTSR